MKKLCRVLVILVLIISSYCYIINDDITIEEPTTTNSGMPIAGISAELVEMTNKALFESQITKIMMINYMSPDILDISDYVYIKEEETNIETSCICPEDVIEYESDFMCDGMYTVTDEEYDTFCHLLYAEAGGQSDECIYAVGSVILNRLESRLYPNTILDVIYQKGQYSPTWHGFMNRKIENNHVYYIADDLLAHGSVLPNYVLGQSSKAICDKWDGIVYDIIDGECFWYEERTKRG